MSINLNKVTIENKLFRPPTIKINCRFKFAAICLSEKDNQYLRTLDARVLKLEDLGDIHNYVIVPSMVHLNDNIDEDTFLVETICDLYNLLYYILNNKYDYKRGNAKILILSTLSGLASSLLILSNNSILKTFCFVPCFIALHMLYLSIKFRLARMCKIIDLDGNWIDFCAQRTFNNIKFGGE